MTDEITSVETWMFRAPNEYWSLILSVLILIGVSYAFALLNIYVFFGLLLLGIVYIQLHQAQFVGNAIRVHKEQFPEIFEIFKRFATHLSIERASLYIIQDPVPNAYTLGLTSCSVILTSGLVEQFSEQELNFVIGHELGHYKAGHTKISTITIPLGSNNIISGLVFGFWQRKTEYSSDRCGLILTKDVDSAISSLLKLSIGGKLFKRLNIHGYISQMKKAEATSVKLSEILSGHPLTTNRVKNLLLYWRESFKKQNEVS